MKKITTKSALLMAATLMVLTLVLQGGCVGGNNTLSHKDSSAIAKKFIAMTVPSLNDSAGRLISLNDAKEIVRRFRLDDSLSGCPLISPSGQNMQGFFIRRAVLDSILMNDNCTGITLYYAKLPDAHGREYTQVIMGTSGDNDDPDASLPIYEHINPIPGKPNKPHIVDILDLP